MTINGVELEFNCFEEQTAKRIVKAAKHVGEIKKEFENTKKLTNEILITSGAVKDVFDMIFGEGTGEKVCGQKNDMLVCMKAYGELINELLRQRHEMEQCTKDFTDALCEISK